MMLGYVKNRQPVLFHSHPGQRGGGGGGQRRLRLLGARQDKNGGSLPQGRALIYVQYWYVPR